MTFQRDPNEIRWRLHLKSPPQVVHRLISTDEGRAKFWAESAVEGNGGIDFRFPNGQSWVGRILENTAPHRLAVEYYGGSVSTFDLTDDGNGGTDLTLTDRGVKDEWRSEVVAGWISVLMALKAAADFSVDLRNHDPKKTWDQGYVEN